METTQKQKPHTKLKEAISTIERFLDALSVVENKIYVKIDEYYKYFYGHSDYSRWSIWYVDDIDMLKRIERDFTDFVNSVNITKLTPKWAKNIVITYIKYALLPIAKPADIVDSWYINRWHNGDSDSGYEKIVVYEIPSNTLPLGVYEYKLYSSKHSTYVGPFRQYYVGLSFSTGGYYTLRHYVVEIENATKEILEKIPKEVVEKIPLEKIIGYVKEGYDVDMRYNEYNEELDVCNTSTSIASCKSTVECLYGDCVVEEAPMDCQEFPAGTFMCAGKSRVKAKAPAVIRYYISDNFRTTRKLIVVV